MLSKLELQNIFGIANAPHEKNRQIFSIVPETIVVIPFVHKNNFFNSQRVMTPRPPMRHQKKKIFNKTKK